MTPTPQFLWNERAPGALGDDPKDRPTLTSYFAPQPTGAAMIVLPGGGYNVVVDHENKPVAEWLNSIGIHAFSVNYRVAPRYQHPAMLNDAARAIRTVRANAAAWGVDPNRIGVIGFSAGGHLAATVSVHNDAGDPTASEAIERVSSRPDLAVLVYPVITMQSADGNPLCGKSLMGPTFDPATADYLSTELHVNETTPPTFIYHRRDDGVVPVRHPLLYAMALAATGVPFECHIYDHVGHGKVFANGDPIDGDWPDRLKNWLRKMKF